MNQAQEFFYELFYGYGAPLGFLLIFAILVALSFKFRYSQAVTIPIAIFTSIWYFSNMATNDNFMWFGVLMLLSPIVMILPLLRD